MRIALLTLESTASAAAAAHVLRETSQEVVFLGISDPFRGGVARTREIVARCGPRILPWLFVEFAAPRLLRPRGAGPLAAAAAARGLRPVVIHDINGAGQAALEAARPDLIVTCHFDQILSPETIALATRGGVNLHPSLLPLHRGPMPCFWAAVDGDGYFGVTVHRLAPRIDAGAVLAQRAVALPAGATVSGIARALHHAGAEMLLQVIDDIAAGRERGREVAALPYRPFPDRAALKAAAKAGVGLAGFGDYRVARELGGVAA
ncbi:formyl transferase [Roseomonas eburnea]|uniref:Formyl transferase n=1 Tax=Neoroseomonas eburnea TaxID=1346889 RepID=A0A9X9X835_9PROT|nr:formyltransferase family protein [Neoroseomonas eburnea]MBR0679871.1 formyl transferase [Neoroseomonas eburnea]